MTSLVEKPLVDEVATTGFGIASVLVLKRVTDDVIDLVADPQNVAVPCEAVRADTT